MSDKKQLVGKMLGESMTFTMRLNRSVWMKSRT